MYVLQLMKYPFRNFLCGYIKNQRFCTIFCVCLDILVYKITFFAFLCLLPIGYEIIYIYIYIFIYLFIFKYSPDQSIGKQQSRFKALSKFYSLVQSHWTLYLRTILPYLSLGVIFYVNRVWGDVNAYVHKFVCLFIQNLLT